MLIFIRTENCQDVFKSKKNHVRNWLLNINLLRRVKREFKKIGFEKKITAKLVSTNLMFNMSIFVD